MKGDPGARPNEAAEVTMAADHRALPTMAPAMADWATTPERSNLLTVRMMAWFALTFGRRVSRALLHPIALYFLCFAPAARRQSQRFLSRALGRPVRWWDTYWHIHRFASIILDRVYLLRGRRDLFDLRVHGEDWITHDIDRGCGAFLLGAHVGSFEVLRSLSEQRRDKLRVAMVMYPDNAQQINQVLAAIAPDVPLEIIPLGRMDSMLQLRDWLDGGGLAGLLGDRLLPGTAGGGARHRSNLVPLNFLGVSATFSDRPFQLAALLRRPVYTMVGLYLGGNRYEIRFAPLADFSDRSVRGPAREQQIREAVHAYARWLEDLCRSSPYNWFNFHDFWCEDEN